MSGRRGGERTSAFSCTVAAAESGCRHAAVPLLRKAAKKPVTVRLAAAVAPLSLVCQQRHLALHSAGIAPKLTARAHNPVTRYENRNGVAPHGTRHGAHTHRRARPSVGHAERQGTIRQGRGKRHIEQLAPHGQLKWGAAQIEIRQGRQWQKSREVSAQPPGAPRPIPRQCIAAGLPLGATWGNGVRPRTIAPKATLPVRPRAKGRAGRASDKVGSTVIRSFSWFNGFAPSLHRGVPSSDNRKHRRRRSPPRSNRAPTP